MPVACHGMSLAQVTFVQDTACWKMVPFEHFKQKEVRIVTAMGNPRSWMVYFMEDPIKMDG